MAQPTRPIVPLLSGIIADVADATALVTFPIRPGYRPFSERTKSRQSVVLHAHRGNLPSTAANAASLAVMGALLPSDDIDYGVDANGRRLPGANPAASPMDINNLSMTGGYCEKIRIDSSNSTATSATGISPISVLNPGSGYTSAPTVVFTGGGGSAAAATAIVSADGRVVGIMVTNAGTGYTSAPAITFTGGGGTGAAAACGLGQFNVIHTKIPFATHAPQTAGGAAYFVKWRNKLIPVTASGAGGLAAVTALTGLDPDQHVMGAGAIATCGLIAATATHPDGTTTITKLTFGQPATNGANFGFPSGDTITVYRVPVEALLPSLGATSGTVRQSIIAKALMWVVITGAASNDADTGASAINVEPVV